jgi:nitronate monooxygenase
VIDQPTMETGFTRLLGCGVPIQQAGFGSSLNVPLVSAVMAAGGLGMIGAPMTRPDVLSTALAGVRARSEGPVGVNFVVPFFDVERDAATLDVAASEADVVEFFYGTPDPDLIARVHDGGALASWQAGSCEEAVLAVEAGCDLVVAQGIEAGGHVRGTRALLPFLCELLEQVDVPVLAAGGITSPRALAAVLAGGAAGARIGTALVVSAEADFHPEYKRALVAAGEGATVHTQQFAEVWPDAPHRVLRSAIAAAKAGDDPVVGTMPLGGATIDVPRWAGLAPTADATGDIPAMALFAGEGVAMVKDVRPAGEIIRELVEGAAELLARASGEPDETLSPDGSRS